MTYYAAFSLNSQWTREQVSSSSFHLLLKEQATTENNLKTTLKNQI